MSNQPLIFESIDMINVEPDEFQGFVYLMEFGDFLKVGSTKKPKARFRTLKSQARYGNQHIGRVALTCFHQNYRENEYILHSKLNKRIPNTELFDCTFEEGLNLLSTLKYKQLTKKEIEQCKRGNQAKMAAMINYFIPTI